MQAMTAALAGTDKAFIATSATGYVGNTGPIPVGGGFRIDPESHSRVRVLGERVGALTASLQSVITHNCLVQSPIPHAHAYPMPQ